MASGSWDNGTDETADLYGNGTWNFDESTGVLTLSGTGNTPSTPFGSPPWVDYSESITRVIIESGFTQINWKSFTNCINLTSVSIPDTVTTIRGGAFNGSGLISVVIPDSVTMIENQSLIIDGAFENCKSLKSVTIGSSLTYLGSGTFQGCTALEEVIFRGAKPEFGIYTGIMSATYGDQFNCGTSDNPVTVTVYTTGWASDDAFICGYNDRGNPIEAIGDYTTFTYEILKPTSGECGTSAFWEYDEASGTLHISGTGAMTNFSTGSPSPWYDYRNDITSVVIDDGITHIGNYAFYYHAMIPSITVPDSVTSIGKYAFASCSNASAVTIGANVTDIQANSFFACKSVKEVYFAGSKPTLGENSFKMGISSTSPATATVYSKGWASSSVFTSTVIGTYTTLTYVKDPNLSVTGIAHVNVNGTWMEMVAYGNVNGVWKEFVISVNPDGTWRETV